MAKEIPFTKMHGAGNDYIYVDTSLYPIENPEEAAILWSAQHTGIGSDGLVLIEPSECADFAMRIFNADGSEAMMCGNASRCIGKYLYEHGLTVKTEISLETRSGIKWLKLQTKNNEVTAVTVDMGEPSEIADVDLGGGYPTGAIHVSMGNPHIVLFVEDIAQVKLEDIGPKLENHPLFPQRINVEFAQILPDNQIRMRVWERGSGITQACGTGACATAVAAATSHRAGRKADIAMDGGTLTIEWNEQNGHVYMTGPATNVFEGVIHLK
ncbi:MAG: diaminopimelate epimerase [Bacteroides sp.]